MYQGVIFTYQEYPSWWHYDKRKLKVHDNQKIQKTLYIYLYIYFYKYKNNSIKQKIIWEPKYIELKSNKESTSWAGWDLRATLYPSWNQLWYKRVTLHVKLEAKENKN